MREVFGTFLRLGLTSFGGPIAHLSYFRRELVERRAWLADDVYTHIVAFCSVLPGPTSSQVGMIAGLIRGGPAGALAAWLGFTAPSAVFMALAAFALTAFETTSGGMMPHWFSGFLAGLTAAAAGIIAQAVLAMARTQCTEIRTRAIAIGAGLLALGLSTIANMQWLPIAAGALAGALVLRRHAPLDVPALPIRIPKHVSVICAAAFGVIVIAAALGARTSPAATLLATIVRAGSLVFGGGHVVLPLLSSLVSDGLIPARDFYAGYGAVQAMPGPVSTFATFIGTGNLSALHGVTGAILATACIFAPSFLLVFALLPIWSAVRTSHATGGALRGANASVVGLLAATLYSPILTSLAPSIARLAIALVAFGLVAVLKLPPWIVVVCAALLGALAALAGAPA
jgi:chromate transporter